jgi:hypothetical protein
MECNASFSIKKMISKQFLHDAMPYLVKRSVVLLLQNGQELYLVPNMNLLSDFPYSIFFNII